MKKISFVKVPEGRVDEYLDKFFVTSAFTFEGLDISNKRGNREMEKLIRKNGYEGDELLCYWFNGNVMNEKYNLTGDNRYPDDLTFVVIPDFYNPMFKLSVGARWFDDIVQNNAYRELEMRGELSEQAQ